MNNLHNLIIVYSNQVLFMETKRNRKNIFRECVLTDGSVDNAF